MIYIRARSIYGRSMSMSKSMSVEVYLGEVCLWACILWACMHLIGVHLMGMHLKGMHLMGISHGYVSYEHASYGRVPHKHASHRRVSHGVHLLQAGTVDNFTNDLCAKLPRTGIRLALNSHSNSLP